MMSGEMGERGNGGRDNGRRENDRRKENDMII